MSGVKKFLLVVVVLVSLVVAGVLLAVRFVPETVVGLADDNLENIDIDTRELAVSFWPLNLKAQAVEVHTEGVAVMLEDIDATWRFGDEGQASGLALRIDHLDLTPADETQGDAPPGSSQSQADSGAQLPIHLLSYLRELEVRRLDVGEMSVTNLVLNYKPDELVLAAEYRSGTDQASLAVNGALAVADDLRLTIADGQYELNLGEFQTGPQNLQGEVQLDLNTPQVSGRLVTMDTAVEGAVTQEGEAVAFAVDLDNVQQKFAAAGRIGPVAANGTEVPGLDVKLDIKAERLTVPIVAAPEANSETQASGDQSTDAAESVEPVAEAEDEAPLFTDTPIDFAWLHQHKALVSFTADSLLVGDAGFENVGFKLGLGEGALILADLSGQIGEGGFGGQWQLQALSEGVESKGAFALEGVQLEQFGVLPQDELKGGAVNLELAIDQQGATTQQLAGSLNGNLVFMVQDAVLANDVIELAGSDMLMETINKLNPFHREDPSTELECARVAFEIEDGVMKADKGIAFETTKMRIIGDGKIDLNDDALDITFTPVAREGVGVNVASVVKFLKIGGRITNPQPEVDALGLLQSGLAIGAAVSTGGVSVVAEGLAKRALNAGSACTAAEAVEKEKGLEEKGLEEKGLEEKVEEENMDANPQDNSEDEDVSPTSVG